MTHMHQWSGSGSCYVYVANFSLLASELWLHYLSGYMNQMCEIWG